MFDSTPFGTSAAWWASGWMLSTRFLKIRTCTNNPTLPGKNEYGDQNQERKYNDKLPEVHDRDEGTAQCRQSI